MGCHRAHRALRQVGGHLASIHSESCHRTPHSRPPMPAFNTMHSILRVVYPHYRPRTTLVMAMALQDEEEVNAMGWPPNQSHRKLWLHGFYFAPVVSSAHSHTSALAPRSLNSGFLHLWFVSIPPLLFFFPMPRQRGKSKRGAAWYNSRGRGRQATQNLPQTPDRASTPDLPPLSSPWACRVEWFDSMGNSLGFAPKLSPEPPPIHQPPSRLPSPSSLPSPTAPLTSSSSPLPSSASPHSSSDVPPPLSPPLPPPPSCARCDGFMKLQNSLDITQNSVFEVKRDMAELLNRDDRRERREERLETLLCALLHTTPDTGTPAKDIVNDPQKERKPGPSSG
jgi:hypothetical protein